MKDYQINEFLHIKGIGAASGLIYYQNVLFIISDNSTFLYQYVMDKELLLKFPLVENAQENIAKKDKLDLEAITHIGNQIFIFGSGSTAQRNSMFSLHLENDALQENDLSELYHSLRELAKLNEDELNIEGAICVEKTMLLFQRGNALNSENGIFIVPDSTTYTKQFIPISLPKIRNIEVSFTDAILVENYIYFLATAEDTMSTYDDGAVLGSLIGKMDRYTFEVMETQIISSTQKFEGITLFEKNDKEINFLLCEDNDTEVLESKIYKLTLKNNYESNF
jgi:hypothetical protein